MSPCQSALVGNRHLAGGRGHEAAQPLRCLMLGAVLAAQPHPTVGPQDGCPAPSGRHPNRHFGHGRRLQRPAPENQIPPHPTPRKGPRANHGSPAPSSHTLTSSTPLNGGQWGRISLQIHTTFTSGSNAFNAPASGSVSTVSPNASVRTTPTTRMPFACLRVHKTPLPKRCERTPTRHFPTCLAISESRLNDKLLEPLIHARKTGFKAWLDRPAWAASTAPRMENLANCRW